METLTINIPEQKSALIRQVLTELGVTIISESKTSRKPSDYAGSISPETAKELIRQVEQSRNEWERNI